MHHHAHQILCNDVDVLPHCLLHGVKELLPGAHLGAHAGREGMGRVGKGGRRGEEGKGRVCRMMVEGEEAKEGGVGE